MAYGVESIYKGILFRSKLETRWAVYFDLMGFEWKYEPCTLDVMDGYRRVRYVPDFGVAFGGNYVGIEVKPALIFESTKEIVAAARSGNIDRVPKHVAALFLGLPFAIVFGEPMDRKFVCSKQVDAAPLFPWGAVT